MHAHGAVPAPHGVSRTTVGVLAWYLAWSSLFGVGLLLRPVGALLWVGLTAAALLLYPRLGRRRWRRRRAAELRLRPIGRGGWRLLAATPLFLGSAIFLSLLIDGRYAGPGPLQLPYRFTALPLGLLVQPAFAVLSAPLLEEISMRGFLQGRLERLAGTPIAVAASAAVFAGLHVSRAWLPYFFVVGLMLSYVLLATRSIWAPVIVHAGHNALVSVARPFQQQLEPLDAALSHVPETVILLAFLVLLGAATLVLPLPRGRRVGQRRSRAGARGRRPRRAGAAVADAPPAAELGEAARARGAPAAAP